MHSGESFATGIGLGLAFELAMHIFVHYTVPGATFAADLAKSIAPALDSMGLTTVFSDAAASAAEKIEDLPSLDSLAY